MKRHDELTRAEAAGLLNTNKAKIIRMEKRGELHPRLGTDRVWYHSEAEVRSVAAESGAASPTPANDAIDASILERLEQGEDPIAVAMALRISIHRVVAIVDVIARLRRVSAAVETRGAAPVPSPPTQPAPRAAPASEFDTIVQDALTADERDAIQSDHNLATRLRRVAEAMARRGGTYDNQSFAVRAALETELGVHGAHAEQR